MKERKPSARTKFTLLHALLADEALSASAKVVATTLLLKFQNTRTGRCNPSVAAIAAAVGRSRRAVFPSIEELKAAQWLTITGTRGGGRGSTNQFTFAHPDKKVKPTAPPTGEANGTPTGEADFTYEAYSTKGCSPLHTNQEEPLSPSERECVGATNERAPDGALEEKFEQLCHVWRKPDGVNRTAAWKAFREVCADHDGDEVLASAVRWVASTPPRYLKKLEIWLNNGAWQHEPAQRQGGSRGGKANPVDEMLNAGGVGRYS